MNIPSYNTKRLSFGSGILYIGPTGTEPTLDIGAVKAGATLTITRDRLEVKQGNPEVVIESWVTSETVKFEISGMEWNLQNLRYALGTGIITTTGDTTTLGFGGDMAIVDVALKFVHKMPAGGTVEIDIWRAKTAGEVTITFGNDPHEFPFTFVAEESDSDWNGNPLEEKARYCLIKLIGDFT